MRIMQEAVRLHSLWSQLQIWFQLPALDFQDNYYNEFGKAKSFSGCIFADIATHTLLAIWQ